MRGVKKLYVKEGDFEEEVSIFNNPSYTKEHSYAERKIRDVRQSLREINAVRKDLVLNFYEISHLLLLIEHKWNINPYSRKSFLCPESVVHPTGYVEDIDAEDCNDMQEAAKKVKGRVADIIETKMLKIRNWTVVLLLKKW